MAQRPSSELFLPPTSSKQSRDRCTDHEFVKRTGKGQRIPTTIDTRGHIHDHKQTRSASARDSSTSRDGSTSDDFLPSEANPNNGRAKSSGGMLSRILEGELRGSRMENISLEQAKTEQKVQDLYATASGVIPPYLLARLKDLSVIENTDAFDFDFPEGLDSIGKIDQVKYFLIMLGRVIDRVSERTKRATEAKASVEEDRAAGN